MLPRLENKSHQGAVALKAFGLAAGLYGLVMLAGYLTFGGHCQGLILTNYDGRDPMALVTRLATLVSLLSSYPLLFTSFRDASFSFFADKVQPLLDAGTKANWAGLSLGLLAVPVIIAILVPDVGFIVSLMGASLGAGLILIIPSLFGRKLLDKSDASDAELGALPFVTAFGWFIGIFGTVVTILETYTDLLN